MRASGQQIRDVVEAIAEGLFVQPERSQVDVLEGETIMTVTFRVEPVEMPRLLGVRGATFQSIGAILNALRGRPVSVKVEQHADGEPWEGRAPVARENIEWDIRPVERFLGAVCRAAGMERPRINVVRLKMSNACLVEAVKPVPRLDDAIFYGAIRVGESIARSKGGSLRMSWAPASPATAIWREIPK